MKAVLVEARMVHKFGGWEIDWMRAEPVSGDVKRDDCKSAAKALANAIAKGNTPSIPAPAKGGFLNLVEDREGPPR